MPNGICIFCENLNNTLEPVVAELVTAARQIKEKTGEPVAAMLIAKECGDLIKQLEELEIDEIYAVETKTDILFKDDLVSDVAVQMLEKIKPSSVLVPASVVSRSIFSRVAAKTGSGLTADCTELVVDKRDDGSFYIKQNKPSFGDNVMVSIIMKEGIFPQMMTIRQGVFSPSEKCGDTKPAVNMMEGISIPESKIEVIEAVPAAVGGDNILSAEVVAVGGKGALDGENLTLLREFTQKIGGALAGTRPLADEGIIPFECQIGQTGFTIRPKICLSFGVSGAIQHTEGIKDTRLYIAVNTDKDAAIFNYADYGVIADMKDILACALETL